MTDPIQNPTISTSERILQAALAVILEAGFERANLEKIAAVAGVTKPTVYSHFGSKVGLLQAGRSISDAACTHSQFSPKSQVDGGCSTRPNRLREIVLDQHVASRCNSITSIRDC